MQQFDEFTKTYGIKEGYGMYLASENKIGGICNEKENCTYVIEFEFIALFDFLG